jgi:predicted DNA-binding transcriptional regulator YafY
VCFGREEKEHEFSAYLLKEYRNRWYTIGFSNKANSILVLALDRIRNIASSKCKYVPDAGFIPSQFFNYSFGITQLHEATPQKVILSFSPEQAEYIISQPLHHSQTIIIKNDEEVKIELMPYITKELRMLILSYGKDVTVFLKDEIKDCIEKMQELYNKLSKKVLFTDRLIYFFF